jgi:hypothetical protein
MNKVIVTGAPIEQDKLTSYRKPWLKVILRNIRKLFMQSYTPEK